MELNVFKSENWTENLLRYLKNTWERHSLLGGAVLIYIVDNAANEGVRMWIEG